MSSLIKQKMVNDNPIKYKLLNEVYPSIEGNLFLHLDNVIIASKLAFGSKFSYHYNFYLLKFINDKSHVEVCFERDSKRIGVYINPFYALKVTDSIKRDLNIDISKKKKSHLTYDFRYNFKNCQRIVKIVDYVLSYKFN